MRPLPRSLQNIYRELHADLGLPTPSNGDLIAVGGARRAAAQPGPHRRPGRARRPTAGKGWEAVTDQAIRALVARGTPLVAILWGRDAQTLRPLLGDVPPDRIGAPEPDVGRSRLLRLAAVQPGQRSCWPAHGAEPVDWRLA